MSLTSKPMWLQGMFMRPQHFQQLGRYVDALVDARVTGTRAFSWGVRELQFDPNLLRVSKLAIERCVAIMPDGLPIALPDQGTPPSSLDISADVRDRVVSLAVPVHAGDGIVLAAKGDEVAAMRYRRDSFAVRDTTEPNAEKVPIEIGRLNLSLVLDDAPRDDFVTLPLARIGEVDRDGAVRLDDTFAPPCLDVQAAPGLRQVLKELGALLHSRGEALASQVDPLRSQGEGGALLEFLMLQTINRYEPLIAHFDRTPGLHPEIVYRDLVALAGEVGTFTTPRRRAPDLPPYDHRDLGGCFRAALQAIRLALANVQEQAAVALPLQKSRYGIWISPVSDRSLLDEARFVLAVSADVHPEELRTGVPSRLKLGPVEEIRDLANLQLPGIPLQPLATVPRELAYRANAVYFELNTRAEIWRRMATSAAFAVHVSGDYPNLRIEFWAIRGESS